jgi:hypothetical protein
MRFEKLTLRMGSGAGLKQLDAEWISRLLGEALADAEPLASGPAVKARHLLVRTTSDTQPEAIARVAAAALMSELRRLG